MKIWCKVLTVLLCVIILSSPALSIYADTVDEIIDQVPVADVSFELSGVRGSAARNYITYDVPNDYLPFMQVDLGDSISYPNLYTFKYHWAQNVTFGNTQDYTFSQNYINYNFDINPYKGSYITGSFWYCNFTSSSGATAVLEASTNNRDWVDVSNIGGSATITNSNIPLSIRIQFDHDHDYDYTIQYRTVHLVLDISKVPTRYKHYRVRCQFTMRYPISFPWYNEYETQYNNYYNTMILPYRADNLEYHYTYENAVQSTLNNISDDIDIVNDNITELTDAVNSGTASVVSAIEGTSEEQTNTITDAIIDATAEITQNNDENTQIIVTHLTTITPEQEEYFDSKIADVEDFTVYYDEADDELESAADSAVDDVETYELPSEFDDFVDDDSWTLFGSIPFDIELVGLFISTLVAIAIVSYIITGKNR